MSHEPIIPVNATFAPLQAFVDELVRSGLTHAVTSPGSRNAPLAFAAYDAAEAGVSRLHTRIDERSAGFLALGLTKVGSRAAVITTSGSAVAKLAPSAAEAAHSGVPVVYRAYDNLAHGFTSFTGAVPAADVACREIAALVREALAA